MAVFTWLHLSDFHLKDPLGPSRELLFSQLLNDIKTQCENGLQPDVVFFTGDIAHSGQKKQYDIAMVTFELLLQACGRAGQRDRLFVIPGNHDVDRSKIPADCTFIRKQILHNVEENYDEINKYLEDRETQQRFFTKFHNYEDFLATYFADSWKGVVHSDQCSYYYAACIPADGDKRVAVIGLNSAWMSEEDNEQGHLFLGHQQVHDALANLRKNDPKSCLKIVLVHHPLYWLAEEDMAAVEPLLSGSRSVLLHGHLHCTRLGVHSDPDASLQTLAAGSGFESRAKLNAYNIVRLNLDTGQAVATLRFQHPEYSPNWGHDTITYRKAKNGKLRFKIKMSE